MKELSIEEKAKAYDEAIERARKELQTCGSSDCDAARQIFRFFPELKENGDDRIRNFISNELACLRATEGKGSDRYEKLTNAIAWLEKQGEQKHETPIPRFNIGDWVIVHNKDAYQVIGVNTYDYRLQYYLGGKMNYPFKYESDLKPWTIQGAKDGDAVACNEEILLFKSYSVQGRISLYCWYNGQTNNFHSKEVTDTLLTTRNKIWPATKEQRDLLFSKMKEAGYDWDSHTNKMIYNNDYRRLR